MITINIVVSSNFFIDIVSKVENFLGLNLTGYEKMIDKGLSNIKKEIKVRNLNLKWYRIETTQLTNGAISLLLYGEEE